MASDISCVELRELLRFILASNVPNRFIFQDTNPTSGWRRLIEHALELGYITVRRKGGGAETHIAITSAGLKFLGVPVEPEGVQRTTTTLMGIWNAPAASSVKPRQRH